MHWNKAFCVVLVYISFVTCAPLDVNVTTNLRNGNVGEEGDFFEGDIIGLGNDMVRNLVRDPHDLWPNKVFIYKFSDEFSEIQKFNVETALDDLAYHTCLQFRERTTESNYVLFRNHGGVCASVVGYIENGGEIPLYISHPGCEMRGQIQHEVLHSLGFWHEHTRPDRDDYIIVHWENIKQGLRNNFEAKTWADSQTLDLPYDVGSVMHYRTKAFSRNGRETLEPRDPDQGREMGQRFRVSKMDLAKLNRLYKCGGRYYNGNYIVQNVPIME